MGRGAHDNASGDGWHSGEAIAFISHASANSKELMRTRLGSMSAE